MKFSQGILGVVATLALASVAAAAGPVTNESWIAIQGIRAQVDPLLAGAEYRQAISTLNRLRSDSRDRQVKSYCRYAVDLCRLRQDVAKGRPGVLQVAVDFDAGGVPASFREASDAVTPEYDETFLGSPGALRIGHPSKDGLLVAESYETFLVEPGTVLALSFYAHDLVDPKLQLLADVKTLHLFWSGPVVNDAWNTMLLRLDLDGNDAYPLGTLVRSISFVALGKKPDAFVILDELQVIAHP